MASQLPDGRWIGGDPLLDGTDNRRAAEDCGGRCGNAKRKRCAHDSLVVVSKLSCRPGGQDAGKEDGGKEAPSQIHREGASRKEEGRRKEKCHKEVRSAKKEQSEDEGGSQMIRLLPGRNSHPS